MELAEVDAFVLSKVSAPDGGRTSIIEAAFKSAHPQAKGDPMRIIDRSLQRLRRAGKIKLEGRPRRWVLAGTRP